MDCLLFIAKNCFYLLLEFQLLYPGAKLAPFNLGVSARIVLPKPIMPCSKFLFLATIFPKNVGEGGGERFKKKFPGIKKRVKKCFWK
jgi:hypothetical protein